MLSDFMAFCFPGMAAFQLAILAVSALLVGVNKSGIPGLGMLPVILLAVAFEQNPGFATGGQFAGGVRQQMIGESPQLHEIFAVG